MGNGACTVQAKWAGDANTAESPWASAPDILVAGIFRSIYWTDLPNSPTTGVTSPALADPVSVPPADNYAIVKTSGTCTWDNTAKTVSFVDESTCVLSVTASKTGYIDLTKDFRISSNVPEIAVTNWGTYGGGVTVGGGTVNAPGLTGLNPNDATKVYTSLTTTVCTVVQNSGTVTGLDDDTCRIELTLSKTGYRDRTHEYSFTVNAGTFSPITWPTFPGTATVNVDSAALGNPASNPTAENYIIARQSGDCTWSEATRQLSFTGTTECVIGVTAQKTGYTDKTQTFRVTPGLSAITITGWGAYGTVTVGGGAVNAPSLTNPNPNDATKAYQTLTAAVCSVDTGTGAVTGLDDDTCRIQLTLSKAGIQ